MDTSTSGILYVAMEFCTQGDLRTYLRRSRKKNQKVYSNVQGFAPMPKAVLLKFALDVASGMSHLAERQVMFVSRLSSLWHDNFHKLRIQLSYPGPSVTPLIFQPVEHAAKFLAMVYDKRLSSRENDLHAL